ncbi:hypothetical protein CUZ96_0534 [Enterococcus lactis]|nr:hypothetical protein [Enterococcus lactis]MBL5004789.1 hypothetical protein [Enterococcus lactis]MBL5010871.1 hypothetical protein [Enterococcus lactis]
MHFIHKWCFLYHNRQKRGRDDVTTSPLNGVPEVASSEISRNFTKI